MSPDEELLRSNEAARIMSDPLIVEAFTTIERQIIDALKRCPVNSRDIEHELTLSLQLLGRLQGHFNEVIQTGKLARITREESRGKKILRAFS